MDSKSASLVQRLKDGLSLALTSLFKPSEVIQYTDLPERDISLIILVLTGMTNVLPIIDIANPLMMVLLILGASIGAVISAILFAQMLCVVGGLSSENGDSNKLRLTIPYSFVPSIIGNIIIFLVNDNNVDMLARIIFGVWSAILMIVLISAVKKASIAKSAIIFLGAVALVLAPVAIVYGILLAYKSA